MSNPRIKTLFKCAFNALRRRPILVILNLTRLCNQNCPMCNIRSSSAHFMPLSDIRRIAHEMARFGIGYVFVQGGEPLLHRDIIEIVDIFVSEGIKPTIITNGVFLTHDLAAAIASRSCNLAVSIDSLDAENYAFLRGSDDLATVLNNIENVSDVTPRKGNWSITTTVSARSSMSDILAIEAYASTHGFMYAIRPYIATVGVAGKHCDSMKYDCEDLTEIFEHFHRKAKKNNYLASLIYKKHIDYIQGKSMPACDAMRYSIALSEHGIFSPCLEYPDLSLDLAKFSRSCSANRSTVRECNKEHPCFYNDAREIGILIRSVPKIIFNSPRIIRQMIKYGCFF